MEFSWKASLVKLAGSTEVATHQVSYNQFIALLREGKVRDVYHFSAVMAEGNNTGTDLALVESTLPAVGKEKIEYLGNLVSANGVQADPTKISAMLEWPTPTSLKKLRGFLGLTSYYRRFVSHYASIASLLTELLKKDNFHWIVVAAFKNSRKP
ncbi:uncharacterized mitochondrial protein AtMg00860-like [Humulus lupulus]|uniref:uncharacterized mitochondrial protein AtMg00860-like n=1 Tax=Humulus lupulus TaxID=3486 RepID=UPI002B412082|nr:uncharacterized mitochondrial protein AtMg00860-like [Humulus lupulus]